MKKKIEGALVRFTFGEGVPELVFDTAKISAECRAYAVPFGFSHRLGDSAATCKTEAERRAAIAALATHYESGATEWNVRTSAGPVQNPIWAAIAAKRGISYETYAAEKQAEALAELAALGD